jgi:hypothetical protein
MEQKIHPDIERSLQRTHPYILPILNAERVNEHFSHFLKRTVEECANYLFYQMPQPEQTNQINQLLKQARLSDAGILSKWADAFNRLLVQTGHTHYWPEKWIADFGFWIQFEDTTTNPADRTIQTSYSEPQKEVADSSQKLPGVSPESAQKFFERPRDPQ